MDAGTTSTETRSSYYFEVFLVALAVILLEISYTRIFSFKVFYYFTYLIIGIALLGLGSGGVLVAVFPRLRRMELARLVPLLCLVAGVCVPVSYLVVAGVQLNVSDLTESWAEIPKLAAICTAMFAPFLLGGVVIAAVFAAHPARIHRLYFADLLGAAIGCSLVVPLLKWLTPPGTVVLCGLLFAMASLPLAARHFRLLLPWSGLVALGAAAALVLPGFIPEPVPDRAKAMAPQQLASGARVLHSEWNPVFRVDVVSPTQGPLEGFHFLVHDGITGSTVTLWDGDPMSLGFFESEGRRTPFRVLDRDPSVLIIGAAGGREVLAALHFGAREVIAVELNPVTVSLMTDEFADVSGRFMHDERVTLVNAEGRNFLKQLERDVDLVWMVAPDTYSALNAATSGAFVLSESYLYTIEMVIESLARLGDDGILCAQFGDIDFLGRPKRTTRYLVTAREALRRLGVEDFGKHVLVSTNPGFPWPGSTILLKRTPFTAEEVSRFRGAVSAMRGELEAGESSDDSAGRGDDLQRAAVWHPAPAGGGPAGSHPVNRVISLGDDELEQWLADFGYDVSPVTDDSPFFWHFVRFRDALLLPWGVKGIVWDPEEATGERVLIVLLAFSVVFAAIMILLPLVAIRQVWSRLPHKTSAVLYFAALGFGFMFFEVSLIQQLTLFLGYPTYSLTVTLFALLVFTAIGSISSERYAVDRNRALGVLLGSLVLLMLWYQLGMGPSVSALSGAAFPVRVVAAVLFVAPLGLCLGAFMPIGLAAVSSATQHKQEIIAWSWAVNGFTSVVASVLATVLSMTIGFRGVQLIAVAIYGIGVLALRRIPEARSSG